MSDRDSSAIADAGSSSYYPMALEVLLEHSDYDWIIPGVPGLSWEFSGMSGRL